jgi:CBS domain-containing protein
MPYFVQELLENKRNVETAQMEEAVQDVLERMLENDFSQLPVVDQKNIPLGLITFESILQAQKSFGVGLDELRVEHALVKAKPYYEDADLFELLNRLRDEYAALIVDGNQQLIGIVTNFDTTEYFRRRAEDMMHVEDIESMIKEYIQAAYISQEGKVDQEKLEQAVQKATNSGHAQREKFKAAMSHYLSLADLKTKPDPAILDRVLKKHYGEKDAQKKFGDLTFSEFMTLLLDKNHWNRYHSIFKVESRALHTLLDKVRVTRNALAHFRDDISPAQRKHLRVSSEWLARYEEAIVAAFTPNAEKLAYASIPQSSVRSVRESSVEYRAQSTIISSIEDEVDPGESRYAALAIHLQNSPSSEDLVKLTFAEIEEIIGDALPQSAYKHRAWWANDPIAHTQSQEWLNVGWRVSSVSFTTHTVSFVRIEERRKAYIDFYSALLNDLRQEVGFKHIAVTPQGDNWHNVESISIGKKVTISYVFSFGRGETFRIELYIDNGDRTANKQLFDQLWTRKQSIEQELSQPLQWQRLDHRRASRIAIVEAHVAITDDATKLAALRQKAVTTMVELKAVMTPSVQAIAHEEL